MQYAGGAVGRIACTGDGRREQALEQTQFRETEMLNGIVKKTSAVLHIIVVCLH